jgi:hypothetical protein
VSNMSMGSVQVTDKARQLAASVVSAANSTVKTIYIQVVNNATSNATTVFQPPEVWAGLGDTVIFNCMWSLVLLHTPPLTLPVVTQGNHSVTQSTFAAPCIPAHLTNATINGFDSGMRTTVNGTAGTILSVPITADIVNTTLWFYDQATCAGGGVGGINVNESSWQTLWGFQRNAVRLNGTAPTSSHAASHPTGTSGSSSSSQSSSSDSSNAATSPHALGALAALPLALLALVL